MSAYTCTELIKQQYADCCFSAGSVEGHPVDTLYVKMVRDDGSDEVMVLLREDEALALVWCLVGAVWAKQIDRGSNNRG